MMMFLLCFVIEVKNSQGHGCTMNPLRIWPAATRICGRDKVLFKSGSHDLHSSSGPAKQVLPQVFIPTTHMQVLPVRYKRCLSNLPFTKRSFLLQTQARITTYFTWAKRVTTVNEAPKSCILLILSVQEELPPCQGRSAIEPHWSEKAPKCYRPDHDAGRCLMLCICCH